MLNGLYENNIISSTMIMTLHCVSCSSYQWSVNFLYICVYRFWPREQCREALYHMPLMPIQTELCVERDQSTGRLMGFKEVCLLGIFL